MSHHRHRVHHLATIVGHATDLSGCTDVGTFALAGLVATITHLWGHRGR